MAITHNTDHTTHAKDPVTGAPDFHPVGTGVGAAAGGIAAGAAIGTVAGPVGTVIGAAVGALAGGLAGKAVAHRVDPDVEDAYWQENYTTRSYVSPGSTYDDYRPAYRYGVNSYSENAGRSFDDVEGELGTRWNAARDKSSLSWDHAKHAARDSWSRVSDTVERAIPGDSDRDGK